MDLRHRLLRTAALAAAFATTGALAWGDRPPEGKESPAAASAACPVSKSGLAGESAPGKGDGSPACDPGARPGDAAASDNKSRASRPDRFGTGFETRRGLGGGGGRGRGRGR